MRWVAILHHQNYILILAQQVQQPRARDRPACPRSFRARSKSARAGLTSRVLISSRTVGGRFHGGSGRNGQKNRRRAFGVLETVGSTVI